MKPIRTHGVVLRTKNRNEADRLLTVLSPDLGRILVLSRGSRKPKSRFLAFSQLFSYGELILQPFQEIYILNQADVLNTYFDIRNDMDRLSCATYITNLTEEVSTTGESNIPLFTLLLQGLTYLTYDDGKPLDIALTYELMLLKVLGYQPGVIFSQSSNEKSDDGYGSLDGGIRVQRETAEAIQTIMNFQGNTMQRISLPDQVRQELNKILPLYINQKLELVIPSRVFLEQIS